MTRSAILGMDDSRAYWWNAAVEAWQPVDPDDWLRLKGISPEVSREPMADDISREEIFDRYERLEIAPTAPRWLGPGEYYFMYCVIHDGTVANIIPYRFKIDAAGVHQQDAPMNDTEIALVRKYYSAVEIGEISDAELKRIRELERRDYRYSLPPPAIAQALFTALPGLPDPKKGAGHYMEACGVTLASVRLVRQYNGLD